MKNSFLKEREMQPILWSKSLKNIDQEKDKEYIIHQTLMYGSIAQIKRLLNFYGFNNVKYVFLHKPKNVYTEPAFMFIKNIVLGLEKKKMDKRKYVKTLF